MERDRSPTLFHAQDGGFAPDELLGPLSDTERVNAPKRLWIAGDRALLQTRPRIAIVGARDASPTGLATAERLSKELVQRGFVIVSGLAEGIDTAAHRSAMSGGGKTIAVIGTPIDRVYPRSNEGLQRDIARDHLVVSQFSHGSVVRRGNFVLRNRTMALLVEASIIVEASDTSGSLSQGWEALRLGRRLFVLESIVRRPDLTWPKKMMDYGAMPISGIDEVLDTIPPAPGPGLVEAPF